MHIRTGLLALLMVAGSMGIAWQQAAPAAACSCAISTTQQHADFAELVVEGTITEVRPPGGVIVSSSDPTVFTVDVDRVWKGEAASTIEISTPSSSASCGFDDLRKDTTLLVFARHADVMGERIDGWGTTLCDGTGTSDPQVTADLTALLGDPLTPSDGAPPPTLVDPGTGHPIAVDRPGLVEGVPGGMLVPLALTVGAGLLAGLIAWLRRRA